MLILPITIVALEYSRLFGWDQKLRVGFLLTIVGLCLVPFPLFDQFNELVSVIGMVISWAAVLFWMLLVPFLIRYRFQTKNYICNAVIGILVIVPAWFGMVGLHTYPYALLGVLVGVWLVDIAGYFIGREFGKIKLLPSVSPGKTREGVLGGFVSVCVYGLGLSLALEHVFTMAQWILFVIIVFAFTAIAVLGDLFESFLKRSSGVKDSGSMLPGHGGMLDRVDSMTALLPFSFLVIQMFVS
jgi:phosphatidate cytidylyltransferase